MGIQVLGVGRYVPDTIATNQGFAGFLDTDDEWITSRTGIHTRHIANGELLYQMGEKASRQAIERAGVPMDEIDMVIGTTVTGDYCTPSLSCLIARELGIEGKICFDINVACSAYVYALDMAERYLRTDESIRNVLIVSAEMLSRMVDYEDRATCVLFGDGAGATVVSASKEPFISFLKSSPQGADRIFAKAHTPKTPFTTHDMDWGSERIQAAKDLVFVQAGSDVYRFATAAMPEAVQSVCEKAGLTPEDMKYIIPHQANIRIIQTAIKRLKVPEEKFYINIERYGNMSSACIPIALSELMEEGKVQKGDRICTVGFGAGLTYGAAILTV